jgi:hypothetical protein
MQMTIVDLFEDKVAYYMTPKCGSRTIFGWGALIKEPDLILKNRDWFRDSAKGVGYSKIANTLKFYKTTNHDQQVRFCIVRDPVDRFLSGFTNRILYHDDIKIKITIDEFIIYFDDIMKNPEFKNAALHFYPQVDSIGDNPNLYTHIFKLSEMSKIKTLLEEYCGFHLPHLHMQQSGGIRKPTLTKEQIEWVKKRYEIDYRIYGKWMT